MEGFESSSGDDARSSQDPASDLREDFQSWSIEQLRAEVAAILSFTAESIHRLALVVAELERRGETLDDLDTTILPILRLVAAGTLLPEIVVKYAGQVRLLLRASKLSVEDQRRVIGGEIDIGAPRKRMEPPPPSEPEFPSAARIKGPRPPRWPSPHAAPRDVGEAAATILLACSDPRFALAVVVNQFSQKGFVAGDAAKEFRGTDDQPAHRDDDRSRGVINGVNLSDHEAALAAIAIELGADRRSAKDSWHFAEGYIGMMEAAERFDHREGVKFMTFANLYIRGKILDQFRLQRSLKRGGGVHRDVSFTDVDGDDDGEWFGNTIADHRSSEFPTEFFS